VAAFDSADPQRVMTSVAAALYLADSFGQFAELGLEMANHWDFASGTAENGTNYGMVEADTGAPFPQYFAMRTWTHAGPELLPVEGDLPDDVRLYPTRREDGSLLIIVLHLASESATFEVDLEGFEDGVATVSGFFADELDTTVYAEADGTWLGRVSGTIVLPLRPWSISIVEIATDG
jgi:hypothetical protein